MLPIPVQDIPGIPGRYRPCVKQTSNPAAGRAIPDTPLAATMLPGIRQLLARATLRHIPGQELHINPVIIQVLPGAAHTDQAHHALPIRSREARQPIVRVLRAGLQAVLTGRHLRELTVLPE